MKRLVMASILALVIIAAAAAHPHVWIDSQFELRVSGNRIEAVLAYWTFDPFFTEMIVLDFGRGVNGTYTPAQVENIRANAFENLRRYGYFTYIDLDGRKIPVDSVRRFDVRLNEENFLEYSFEVSIDSTIDGRSSTLKVSMYDETFFTDIAYRNDYAIVSGADGSRYRKQLTRDRHMVPVWGPMTRETVEIVVERR